MYLRDIAFLFLLLGLTHTASAQTPVPQELTGILAEHGCVQIADDAEVLKNRGRWWVSLKQITGGDADFAIYCLSPGDNYVSTLILVINGAYNPWRGCTPVVSSWSGRSSFPLDLAIVDVTSTYSGIHDLGSWWLASSASNPKATPGPARVNVPGPIIDTTGERAGSLFACYAGQWYRIGLD
jgi:hypothetical protein